MAESPKLDVDTSVVKSLFLGEIFDENLFPFPEFQSAEAETLRMVLESIDRFMSEREADFHDFDQKGAQTDEYIESLKELGLFGLIIPEEYGGIGFSNAAYSRVIQQTSRYDASTSLTIGAHSSIGMKGLLLFGSDDQKKRYLPRLASGEMIAAFCLTEPGSGSDAGSIKTSAVKLADGSWQLNGEKIWITNGAFAEFFTVFARTDSAEGKLSAFIVERKFPGVATGPKEDKLGIRASATTTVSFDNVLIPAANLLGTEGQGFKIAMEILNNGRTGLGGGCVGGMKASIARCAKQAAERKQFGRPIAEFALVKEKIAQMTIDCFAAESVVAMVGHYIDSGLRDYSLEAAISKVFCSEAMWRTAGEALQIAGGNGYMKEFPYERTLRDSRINMIFEGTNEILRLYIALSGLKDAGTYLKDVSKSFETIFNDPIKGFGVLSGYATRRFQRMTSFGRDRMSGVAPQLQEEAIIFEKATQDLAHASDALLRKYRKDIIGKQLDMKRLADTAIDLFVGCCILSRVSKMLNTGSEESNAQPLLIAKTFAQQARRRMNFNVRRIERDNEDQQLLQLSDYIVAQGKFPWDLV